ncbi:MAG TPA: hypothetical protein VD906_00580 [Caulobacteraceae bacterium]|nr:hypothetical protein [Caulobacteraceae bacterium]
MDQAYIIQFAVSAAAIVLLAAVAAWARIPRKVEPLTEPTARALIAEELPDVRIERVWVDADGAAAVAKAGGEGVVLFRVGDGFAVRTVPWDEVCRARALKGRALFRFGDPAAPACAFKLAGERLPFGEAA